VTEGPPSGAHPGWAGAVLAGGASRRMGKDKASLAGNSGERLLDRACDLLSGLCASVMAVGTNLPLQSGIQRVEDPPGIPPSPVRGILGALENSRQPHVLFLPVDLPGMTPDILESIQSEMGSHPGSPVVAISPTGPEPLISAWPASMAEPLRNLVQEGRLGAWEVSRELGAVQLRFEEVSEDRIHRAFKNVNTPDDWETFLLENDSR